MRSGLTRIGSTVDQSRAWIHYPPSHHAYPARPAYISHSSPLRTYLQLSAAIRIMTSPSTQSSAIIIGVGPWISRSLALFLASKNCNIGLVSRTQADLDKIAAEVKAKNSKIHVVTRTADAGFPASLTEALDSVKKDLGGHVDVLVYNAAHVGPSKLMEVHAKMMQEDFRVAAVGTLVAGQWFSKNADTSNHPILLITGGTLDREPQPDYASLSCAKAAAQNISVMFSKVLPKEYGIKVGTPLIVEPIIPDGDTGKFVTKSNPDDIVENIFKPYFDDKTKGNEHWTVERIF